MLGNSADVLNSNNLKGKTEHILGALCVCFVGISILIGFQEKFQFRNSLGFHTFMFTIPHARLTGLRGETSTDTTVACCSLEEREK